MSSNIQRTFLVTKIWSLKKWSYFRIFVIWEFPIWRRLLTQKSLCFLCNTYIIISYVRSTLSITCKNALKYSQSLFNHKHRMGQKMEIFVNFVFYEFAGFGICGRFVTRKSLIYRCRPGIITTDSRSTLIVVLKMCSNIRRTLLVTKI